MKFRKTCKRSAILACFLALAMICFAAGSTAIAAEAEAEHGGGHGEGAKGWVATDTYRVMNFVVLAGVLIFLLRKPVSKTMNDRIKNIQSELEELEAKKADAEKALEENNRKLATLDKEAEQIVEQYIQQGKEAKERILEEARSSADRLEEQAKRNIEHEFESARRRLQEEIIEKAIAKAEEIVKEEISKEDQERLVDEYLEKVVA
jgi:F-type H+-transporting ATPase subunit b